MNLSNTISCVRILAVIALVFGTGVHIVEAQTKRDRDPSTAGRSQKDPLLGRWQSDEAAIEFRSDGSITINGEQYVYRVKNSVITVSGDEGQMLFPYRLDGDTLLVDVEGREVVYTRVKGGGGSGVPGGRAAGGEGVIQALVGKWCYMSNLTGSNSRMSSRCFVLNGDGTYEYSAESSSSGAVASSASQEYDSGRWTATADSLTAYSESNGKIVYPLELRNHPKTGDPMLVVDGDAYVTAYQREPW